MPIPTEHHPRSINHIRLTRAVPTQSEHILTPAAQEFVAQLAQRFSPRIETLLNERSIQRTQRAQGEALDFLERTRAIRLSDWTVAPIPKELADRRVEITGPPERKIIVNALNSGSRVFMADFEDSMAPTWKQVIAGQHNLFDAVRRQIDFTDPVSAKPYALCESPAALMVRPRGLHLTEAHMLVDGRPVPASLFDFGLYLFHNANELVAMGSGPYFYLPKLESHQEARLWNDVFVFAQSAMNLPLGTIKATVLIETLPAAFEMDEILFELREHSAGLNCGRWDYIFSAIKTMRDDPSWLLPDRSQIGMAQPFMKAYTELLVQTCHRRGVHAMGGMAAQIPLRGDAQANAQALASVREDKQREVRGGHDGTWVAHPGLVELAMSVFDSGMAAANQIAVSRETIRVTAADLLSLPHGSRTVRGVQTNIEVGIRYLESWLRGVGCVPLFGLMEDAATAEISRAQLWQWTRVSASLEAGDAATPTMVDSAITRFAADVRLNMDRDAYRESRFDPAISLFRRLVSESEIIEFLTLPAYQLLLSEETSHDA